MSRGEDRGDHRKRTANHSPRKAHAAGSRGGFAAGEPSSRFRNCPQGVWNLVSSFPEYVTAIGELESICRSGANVSSGSSSAVCGHPRLNRSDTDSTRIANVSYAALSCPSPSAWRTAGRGRLDAVAGLRPKSSLTFRDQFVLVSTTALLIARCRPSGRSPTLRTR